MGALLAKNTAANLVVLCPNTLNFPVDVYLAKNGGGFSVLAAQATLIDVAGPYKFGNVALTAGDTDTLGTFAIFLFDGVTLATPSDPPQVVTALPGDPGELTNPERDAVAAAVLGLSNGVDTGVSLAHAMMALTAFLTGLTPTFGPITRYRNWANTKDRVTMTTDPTSGRLSVVFDFS